MRKANVRITAEVVALLGMLCTGCGKPEVSQDPTFDPFLRALPAGNQESRGSDRGDGELG